jgi:membrane-associated phospholipid phosphatase
MTPPVAPPRPAGQSRPVGQLRLLAAAGVPLAVLTATVLSGWAALADVDDAVGGAFHSVARGHAWLVRVADVVAVAFHPNVFRVAVGVTVVWLLWRRDWLLAWWAALTMTVGSVVSVAGKLLTARDRPVFAEPVGHATGYAFPSGHALNSAVGVLVLAAVVLPLIHGRWTRYALLGFGAFVVLLTGVDRLVLGVHHLTDVVAGWLAAVVVVAATTLAVRPPPPLRGGHLG